MNMETKEIQGRKVIIRVKRYDNKDRPNIKAYVTLIIDDIFKINGFTIRTSDSDRVAMSVKGLWVGKPMFGKFRCVEVIDSNFWSDLEGAIIDEFINGDIPIIN